MKKPLHLFIGNAAGITGCAVIGALSRAEMALCLLESTNVEIFQHPHPGKTMLAACDPYAKEPVIETMIIRNRDYLTQSMPSCELVAEYKSRPRLSHRLDNSSFITGKKSYKNKRR